MIIILSSAMSAREAADLSFPDQLPSAQSHTSSSSFSSSSGHTQLCSCLDDSTGGIEGAIWKHFCGACAWGTLMSMTGQEGEGPAAVANPGNCLICTIFSHCCLCCNIGAYVALCVRVLTRVCVLPSCCCPKSYYSLHTSPIYTSCAHTHTALTRTTTQASTVRTKTSPGTYSTTGSSVASCATA